MKIAIINKKIYTPKYLRDRDIVWKKKIREYRKKKTPLWNGVVYYLDKISNNTVHIGLCEYKDLLFIEGKNIDKIKKQYGLKFNFIYINVQTLISNKNGIFIFGTQKRNRYTEIISVGGTLRLENGNYIKNFTDIKNYAKNELLIETKIKVTEKKLKFLDIIINNNICTFLFHYPVKNFTKKLLNLGEFDGQLCIKKDNIYDYPGTKPHPRLNSLKNYFQMHGKAENH